ncbi:non-ribosomal peptide synthetase [Kitasatospora sp. NPDC018058]|uniref:non-ribosomal peptide synthetase n=1 Tax=Kitasatospora sp. NPDC018058 TaxID=3364025 RepID=UPI0037BEB027
MVSASIQERFASQVRRTPDAVAVSGDGVRLTYRELDERANRIAHRLLGLGVRPEEPVAVLMERSVELVAAVLGVVKAGACYLPLHDSYPLERMRRIVHRAGPAAVLTDHVMRGRARALGLTVVESATDPQTAALPATDPGVVTGPDQAVYVIHTSGSTGEPKGVTVTHRGVLGLAADSLWDGGAHDRVLMVAPYAFGVSTYELWVPLLRGGHVVVAPPGDLDLRTLRRLIEEEAVTGLHLTAGLFRVLAEEAPESFAGVREVLTGGDVIAPAAVRRVLEACPDTVVRAMYGATEVSSFALHAPLTAADRLDGAVPVGGPLDGVLVRLLDRDLNPVADGEVGELYLAGGRLASGYFASPELTAERFVEDPFGAPGTRMYRTGDLMRRGARGLLEFAGRAGDQVKIRGYRVEPAEVEHVLARQPGVVHAAVVVQEPQPGEGRLVAYVVPRTPGTDLAALRAAVAQVLPDYMVPAAFAELDALPLTPNGKLDRAALPAPAPASAADSAAHTPPRDRDETVLCTLVARVLGVAAVNTDDNFFDLGGQSLQAMRLASRIEAELGAEVSVVDVLNHPTVTELAERVRELTRPTRSAAA